MAILQDVIWDASVFWARCGVRSCFLFLGLALCGGSVACAQSAISMPAKGAQITGYLVGDRHWHSAFAPPPVAGSLADDLDMAAIAFLQGSASQERWRDAKRDEDAVYARFVEAFGGALDREHAPAMVHLLNRALKDLDTELVEAKLVYPRPRPFQRAGFTRVCSPGEPAGKGAPPTRYDSYPSGHGASGWLVALILARAAPDRKEQLLARAADYGLSREVCAMHFPSDVEGGRVLAVDLLAQLESVPDFRSDMECVVAEYQKERGFSARLSSTCTAMVAGPPSRAE